MSVDIVPRVWMDKTHHRGVWARRVEFVLASVGYVVGSGNVWRFPYVCYRNGGGAFLIPYIIMLFLCAIPMVFLEFVVDRHTQMGPVQAFAKICPLMKGVGTASVVTAFLTCIYFNTTMSWGLFYMFHSFTSPLPWTSCNNTWNVLEHCSSTAHTDATPLRSPSQQFFE